MKILPQSIPGGRKSLSSTVHRHSSSRLTKRVLQHPGHEWKTRRLVKCLAQKYCTPILEHRLLTRPLKAIPKVLLPKMRLCSSK